LSPIGIMNSELTVQHKETIYKGENTSFGLSALPW